MIFSSRPKKENMDSWLAEAWGPKYDIRRLDSWVWSKQRYHKALNARNTSRHLVEGIKVNRRRDRRQWDWGEGMVNRVNPSWRLTRIKPLSFLSFELMVSLFLNGWLRRKVCKVYSHQISTDFQNTRDRLLSWRRNFMQLCLIWLSASHLPFPRLSGSRQKCRHNTVVIENQSIFINKCFLQMPVVVSVFHSKVKQL